MPWKQEDMSIDEMRIRYEKFKKDIENSYNYAQGSDCITKFEKQNNNKRDCGVFESLWYAHIYDIFGHFGSIFVKMGQKEAIFDFFGKK